MYCKGTCAMALIKVHSACGKCYIYTDQPHATVHTALSDTGNGCVRCSIAPSGNVYDELILTGSSTLAREGASYKFRHPQLPGKGISGGVCCALQQLLTRTTTTRAAQPALHVTVGVLVGPAAIAPSYRGTAGSGPHDGDWVGSIHSCYNLQ